jgi:hypothetical protein
MSYDGGAGRFRFASPKLALILALPGTLLLVAVVPLTVLTGDLRVSSDGMLVVIAAMFAMTGVVVAYRQPFNATGWIMLAVGLVALLQTDAKLYAVLAYRTHHGGLPFSRVVVYYLAAAGLSPFIFGLPAILLFPDGRLPSRRWRWVVRVYIVLSTLFLIGQFADETAIFGRPVHVDALGNAPGNPHPAGIASAVAIVAVAGLPLPILWLSFIGRQIQAWRRADGERREQLKWLVSGAAVCVAGSVVTIVGPASSTLVDRLVRDSGALAIAGFPLAIGIGILRYRLYEIDRLISRTLSYAILTGLLVGIFVGIVALATDVLPFSSPVAVAASTLAAAALFNPLRLRVQRVVDRRFNRARYDAEAIVATFTMRLRDAVDLDTVRSELLLAVDRAVEPAHASLWIRPDRSR